MLRVVGFLVMICSTMACSPEGWVNRKVAQRILEDDVALYGKIVNNYPDHRFSMHHENVFTAEMEVFCVLKGPPSLALQRYVNISEAGFVPGMCHSTTLEKEGIYIVTLYDQGGGRLVPVDSDLKASEHLQEVSRACGIHPFTPAGVDVNMCPPMTGPDTCVEPEIATVRPPPTYRPPPHEVEVAPSEEDSSNSVQTVATLSLITMATLMTKFLF